MGEFDGLKAIVTGGASGIGAATAAMLIGRGATVAVLDVSFVSTTAGVPLQVPCDIANSESSNDAITEAAKRLGGIDIVVNNAGIGAVGDVTENSEAEWRRVLDVNVIGIARTSRAALPYLQESSHAAVVNVASIVAHVGVVQRALYAASKGAIHALTLAMAADHLKDQIRVTAVSPGTADTPWVGRLLEQSDDADAAATALRHRQPMGRLVSADEIAAAICYLASPLASATTGTVLHVDGGMSGVRV